MSEAQAAAASDRANCCFALQKWGGHDFAIDAVDRDGRHALSLSAESGAARSSEELLRMGADVHLRDKAGRTALHYACIDGNARVASILINMEPTLMPKTTSSARRGTSLLT